MLFFFFIFISFFDENQKKTSRVAPDGTPRFAASYLGLFCLHRSHKKDARLIRVKKFYSNVKLLCLNSRVSRVS